MHCSAFESNQPSCQISVRWKAESIFCRSIHWRIPVDPCTNPTTTNVIGTKQHGCNGQEQPTETRHISRNPHAGHPQTRCSMS